MKRSYFHKFYTENKEVCDVDAFVLPQKEFLNKYRIGVNTYLTYFKGSNKGVIRRKTRTEEEVDEARRYKHEQIKLRANERQENSVEYFNKKVKSLAHRFRKSEKYIRNLALKFTITEIEHGELKNGEVICHDEIMMSKPKDIHESMFNYSCGMV